MPDQDSLKDFDSFLDGTIGCLDLLRQGFDSGDMEAVAGVECATDATRQRVTSMTESLVKETASSPELGRYVSVPAHLARIQGNMERITTAVRREIQENILFSDRAVSEIGFMFEKVSDIIGELRQLLGGSGSGVADHIIETENAVERAASEFSTKHEERLIEGVCMPKASMMYLEILEAFKDAAWHAREIARELGT
jgi:Na+/phosphate symporter